MPERLRFTLHISQRDQKNYPWAIARPDIYNYSQK